MLYQAWMNVDQEAWGTLQSLSESLPVRTSPSTTPHLKRTCTESTGTEDIEMGFLLGHRPRSLSLGGPGVRPFLLAPPMLAILVAAFRGVHWATEGAKAGSGLPSSLFALGLLATGAQVVPFVFLGADTPERCAARPGRNLEGHRSAHEHRHLLPVRQEDGRLCSAAFLLAAYAISLVVFDPYHDTKRFQEAARVKALLLADSPQEAEEVARFERARSARVHEVEGH
uniref:Uncharacterized protein n=1 Tax=Chromera velia CCMP2878 TaxID=1169474 RepID=A0A0G4IF26_9ALVE|eukprot:Cvel_13758.t1-p1 / transcript=Cvel_13758.t1 / gene=Cvel_13758 / organism=Chromera_velia_CCMP2878 / gene_product=hypothetical protein / transcript_product=hypothetical protein / location=Cvel_scaffold953:2154-4151(+) / protein_length=226 / sequence_SO=supercontig / SO=protein_coding / is_pseudo=false